MTIRHIVFDIGRVLIHYDPHLGLQDILPDADERAWFLTHVCTHEWNLEQDRGRSWAEAEAEAIARHPDQADRIRAFRANWHKMVPHAYDETVAILGQLLDQGHDITFLTNFASDTFREAQARYPFLATCRGVTVSGDEGLIKPDPALYHRHVARFDLDPAATYFIDDSLPNVETARALGWSAHHFRNAEALKADLERFGIGVKTGERP